MGLRIINQDTFSYGQVKIAPSGGVKYLGISLDDNIIFGEYMKKTKKKAERSLGAYTQNGHDMF